MSADIRHDFARWRGENGRQHPFQSALGWDCGVECRMAVVRKLRAAGDTVGLQMVVAEGECGGPPLQATVRKAAEGALRRLERGKGGVQG